MDLIRGSGFIASHLKNYLASLNREVKYIDRALTYYHYDIDTVYYLASYGNMYDQRDETLTYKVNSLDVDRLLNKLNGKFQLFVYFSTSSVYGIKKEKMSEGMKLEGKTPYALSKIQGEFITRKHGLKNKCVIIRPFTVIGVGEQSSHLIPTAINRAFDQKIMNVDPDPVHDYIDVEDLCKAIQTIVDYHSEWDKGKTEVYNIGSGKQKRNDEIIDLIESETQSQIQKKIVKKLRNYDNENLWCADICKISKLGWKPTTPLYETIKKMVEYERNRLKKGI